MFSRRHKKPVSTKVRDFVWPKIGLVRSWQYLVRRLARIQVSSHKLALGFAAGAFASFTPLIGLHFVLAALVAIALRGNLFASAVGTAVGNPVTFPFIWLASYNLGALFIGVPKVASLDLGLAGGTVSLWRDGPVAFSISLWESISPYLLPMMLGGSLLGIIAGVACYFVVSTAINHVKNYRRARTA